MENAVIVESIGKQYCSYHQNRSYSLMGAALAGWRHLQPKKFYWALRDVSFQVARGEMLGIIGRNGAGKSTLLKLMGGVLAPDQGKVIIKGRIGSLLSLGNGFHTDLTGRENALFNGIVAGLTRREMVRCMSSVVEFAELEAAIDNPVRTYSTGMKMRLAFSVAVHTNPEVMLVDEFLSVGDKAFQAKCLARIDELKMQGTAIVLVSHNVDQIEKMCDRVLWLRRGRIHAYGNGKQIVQQYLEVINASSVRGNQGTKEVEITQVQIQDQKGASISKINSGDGLTITIDYHCTQSIGQCLVELTICNQHQRNCFETTTTVEVATDLSSRLQLNIARLDLNSGQYNVNVNIYDLDHQQIYDRASQVCFFDIETIVQNKGVIAPPHQWRTEFRSL